MLGWIERCKWALRCLIRQVAFLIKQIVANSKQVRVVIFASGGILMLANLGKAVQASLQAVICFLILWMSVSIAALGAFTISIICWRLGEFVWDVFGKSRWLG